MSAGVVGYAHQVIARQALLKSNGVACIAAWRGYVRWRVGVREELEPCREGLWVPSLVVNNAIGAELMK